MRKFLIVFFAILPLVSGAASLEKEISKTIKGKEKYLNMGIYVQSMKTGKVVYQHHPERLLIPASVLKIFTGAASLSYLGPDYQYETALLLHKNKIKKGVLHGNLTVRFSGDPSLTNHDIDDLFLKLKKKKITKIAGNIHIDANQFGDETYGPGWMLEDMPYCYSAPISAININQNCIRGYVKPGTKAGEIAPFISYDPFVSSHSKVKTVKAKKGKCVLHIQPDDKNEFQLKGCVKLKTGKHHYDLAIKNPFVYAQNVIRAALKHNGIQLTGKIILAETEAKQRTIAKHQSVPLLNLCYKMLKESDNTIADTLLKTIGLKYSKSIGTWENSVEGLKLHLAKMAHIDFDKAVIVDGSGLSRYNLISAKQVSELLKYTYHQFSISPEFIANLPIGGVDGTLAKRLEKIRYQVRAKTGGMDGVTGLAGYVNSKKHGILSFVILINGRSGDDGGYQHIVDKIVEDLALV